MAQGPAALDLLVAASGPDQPLALRFTAVPFLRRIHDPKALDALERLTANTEDRNIRTSGLQALAASGDSARAAAVALRLIADPDPLFASAAVRTGARVGGAAARAQLTQALAKETRVLVRLAIQQVLTPASGH
jgi:HEAT repeat protein